MAVHHHPAPDATIRIIIGTQVSVEAHRVVIQITNHFPISTQLYTYSSPNQGRRLQSDEQRHFVRTLHTA